MNHADGDDDIDTLQATCQGLETDVQELRKTLWQRAVGRGGQVGDKSHAAESELERLRRMGESRRSEQIRRADARSGQFQPSKMLRNFKSRTSENGPEGGAVMTRQDELEKQVVEQHKHLAELSRDLVRRRREVEVAVEVAARLQKDAVEKESDIQRLTAKLSEASGEVREMSSKMEVLREEAEKLGTSLAQCEEALDTKSREYVEVVEDHRGCGQKLMNLERKVKEGTSLQQTLTEQNTTLQVQLRQVKLALGQAASLTDTLVQENDTLVMELNRLSFTTTPSKDLGQFRRCLDEVRQSQRMAVDRLAGGLDQREVEEERIVSQRSQETMGHKLRETVGSRAEQIKALTPEKVMGHRSQESKGQRSPRDASDSRSWSLSDLSKKNEQRERQRKHRVETVSGGLEREEDRCSLYIRRIGELEGVVMSRDHTSLELKARLDEVEERNYEMQGKMRRMEEEREEMERRGGELEREVRAKDEAIEEMRKHIKVLSELLKEFSEENDLQEDVTEARWQSLCELAEKMVAEKMVAEKGMERQEQEREEERIEKDHSTKHLP